jgi:nucleotide-binding universal stress UspA family protein
MMGIKKILVPTDFSENSGVGLKFTFVLAVENRADLLILHLAREFQVCALFGEATFYHPRLYRWDADGITREANLDPNRFLGKHEEQIRRLPAVRKRAALDDVVRKIVDVALHEKADLIVMPPHPHGTLRRFLLGGVTDRVTRMASCPVLSICPPHTGRVWSRREIALNRKVLRGSEA